jgi:DNA integrity scanning protein DisA with diadenylate cyclase activity
VHSINIAAKEYEMRKKKMLLELASMDGAIIFDSANVLAVGAMIETHPFANDCAGARATAAKSAVHHGGTPIKISSDGEISLHFSLETPQGVRSCHQLNFM